MDFAVSSQLASNVTALVRSRVADTIARGVASCDGWARSHGAAISQPERGEASNGSSDGAWLRSNGKTDISKIIANLIAAKREPDMVQGIAKSVDPDVGHEPNTQKAAIDVAVPLDEAATQTITKVESAAHKSWSDANAAFIRASEAAREAKGPTDKTAAKEAKILAIADRNAAQIELDRAAELAGKAKAEAVKSFGVLWEPHTAASNVWWR